jgi:BCD family chlorophyll transporter-like MFS transporter
MGVWGAAQAGAFALGGFIGALGVDLMRGLLHQAPEAFLVVFCGEAGLFLVSAALAARLEDAQAASPGAAPVPLGAAR